MMLVLFLIFFFQAEDGIRDYKVTGVQTCALPISGDISDSYESMSLIGFGQNGLEKFAGPGHWNDPDMLEIGNGHMNRAEYRTHMALWALLAAPLLAGNDLRDMSAETKELLTSSEVIAVDQDSKGIQGHRFWQEGPLEIW